MEIKYNNYWKFITKHYLRILSMKFKNEKNQQNLMVAYNDSLKTIN